VRPALERALSAVMGNQDLVPVLARMLGLPGGAGLVRLGPEQLQRATFAALRSVVSRLVGVGPTVLVLEDLHWATPPRCTSPPSLPPWPPTGPSWYWPPAAPTLAPSSPARALRQDRHQSPCAGSSSVPCPRRPSGSSPDPWWARSPPKRSSTRCAREWRATLFSWRNAFLHWSKPGRWCKSRYVAPRRRCGDRGPPVTGAPRPSRVDRLSPLHQGSFRTASVLGYELGLGMLEASARLTSPWARPSPSSAPWASCRSWASCPSLPTASATTSSRRPPTGGCCARSAGRLHARTAWALEAHVSRSLEEVAALLGRPFRRSRGGRACRAVLRGGGDHATAAFANDEAVSSLPLRLAIVDGDRSAVK